MTSAVSVQFSTRRSFSSALRDKARRRADRKVRATLITAIPTCVLLESQLVVGVGERSAFGLACHARKEGEDNRDSVRQSGKWGNRTLHETSPWFRGANPVVMCIFAGFAALGSGVPRTVTLFGCAAGAPSSG